MSYGVLWAITAGICGLFDNRREEEERKKAKEWELYEKGLGPEPYDPYCCQSD